MKAVFPGRPQAKLQAVSTVQWAERRITVYIAGSALIVLGAPNELLQSITLDNDAQFTAVAIDEVTGKIAASTGDLVYVYQPFGLEVDALKWSLQHSLTPTTKDEAINSLSWGLPHELLASGASLTLFSTGRTARELSTRKLANSAKFAKFSHDASLIASTGQHDRLVKIWRRLFYGGDNARFDTSYLAHPATVTHLRWRGRPDQEQHCEPVLYTLCADNKLRIWTVTDPHGLQALQLWSELDLSTSLQPRAPLEPGEAIRRYVFYIDSWDFKKAVTKASNCDIQGERELHALNHLKELATEDLEVCVILDDRGNMSAWGLEHVGQKERKTHDVVNIAHAEGLELDFARGITAEEDYVSMYSFLSAESDVRLCLLAQFFDGRLQWLECPLYQFFNPLPQTGRLQSRARLTGHEHTIEALRSFTNGEAYASIASHGETVIWCRKAGSADGVLERHSIILAKRPVLEIVYSATDNYAVLLSERTISVWNTRTSVAQEVVKQGFHCDGSPLLLMWFPSFGESNDISGVATMTSKGEFIVWQVSSDVQASARVTEMSSSLLNTTQEFTFCQAMNSTMGGPVTGTGFEHDILSCDVSGQVVAWHFEMGAKDDRIRWSQRSTLDSGVTDPFLFRVSCNGLVALVDSSRTTVSIWNTALGCLEHSMQFQAHEEVYDVSWTANDSDYAILAISFRQKTIFYIQSRYNTDGLARWLEVAEISIAGLVNINTSASTWITGSDFVLAAGQQIFLYGAKFDIPEFLLKDLGLPRKRQYHLPALLDLINGPLPLFHPTVMDQCLLSGRATLLHEILRRLQKSLRYYTTGDELESFLGLDFLNNPIRPLTLNDRKAVGHQQGNHINGGSDEDWEFTETTAADLVELLSKVRLPHLLKDQQDKVSSQVKQASFVAKQQASVDEFAVQYLVELSEASEDSSIRVVTSDLVSWRKTCWAYHSTSQEILIDLTSRQYKGQVLWQHARDSGMFMWMTDLTALRAQFEVVARSEYTKTDEKNPVDCTLYYLALRKKQVLSGLWRMATWHREQGATQRLLANNFSDPRWKSAALKNAYALLGKRRYEYAASFFLLADNLQGAVGVLSSQLGDVQLAIAVARVYEGDDGPVLRSLLQDMVLPKAAEENNQWLASWGFWMLNKKNEALQALTMQPPASNPTTKRHSTQDPNLVVFYARLRDKLSKESRTSPVQISPKAEWDLVIRSARLYLRMGCDMLALDLVRNWKFLAAAAAAPLPMQAATTTTADDYPAPPQAVAVESEASGMTNNNKTRSLLDDYDREEASSNSTKTMAAAAPASNGGLARKKVFEEPSTSSIFDNFNF